MDDYIAQLNESIEDLLQKTAKLYLFRARKHKETKRFRELLDDIERGVACCGDDLGMRKDFFHLQAEFFMERKDCERADRALRSVFELYTSKKLPCDAQTLMLNDKLEMMKGDCVSAQNCFKVVMETSGKNSSMHTITNSLSDECSTRYQDHLELDNGKPSESKMDGLEKLIYLHVNKLGELSMERPNYSYESYNDATNDWHVLKHGSDGGVELSRAFEDITQLNYPNAALESTICQVIGSCIYVMGGHSILSQSYYSHVTDAGSRMIRYLDTRNPRDGWRACATLPSNICEGKSAVVDEKWLYVFGIEHQVSRPPEGYAVNVMNIDDGTKEEEKVRKITLPNDSCGYPTAFACLSPGLLVAYFPKEGSFYQLDCSNSTWTVYQKDLHFKPSRFPSCTTVSDDGIFYIYDTFNMRFTSYDICNKKELFVIDLPRSVWFGYSEIVNLIVLAKNKFCIVWRAYGESVNFIYIYYARFSVCYDQGKPTVVEEEKKKFHIGGTRLINVVAVDPHSDAISNRLSCYS